LACLAWGASIAVAAPAEATKSIALILDASGSMNAKLPEGRTRIEAAKAAVEEIVGKLPSDVRISLRAYGHQSPKRHFRLEGRCVVPAGSSAHGLS
jgi:Ca-activated chloride channel family protein